MRLAGARLSEAGLKGPGETGPKGPYETGTTGAGKSRA